MRDCTDSIGMDILNKLLALSIIFKPQALHIFRQANQRCLEEATVLLTLFDKMRRTESQLGVCCTQTLIALLHAGWDIRRLADLIPARETSIKDLEDQDTESIRIDCRQWVALNSIPATLDDFRGCEASCVWD